MKLTNIQTDYENRQGLYSQQTGVISARIANKQATGQEVTADDYRDQRKSTQTQLKNLQNERSKLTEQFNKLLKSGVIEEGDEEWYKWQTKFSELDEQIIQTQTDIAGINDVEEKLKVVDDNIVVSQLNDLKQLYSTYMEQGYCTIDQREGFVTVQSSHPSTSARAVPLQRERQAAKEEMP